MKTYKYKANLITSHGKLEIIAISNEKGEVLARFEDDDCYWHKIYNNIDAFKYFIGKLYIKDVISISEIYL